VLVVDDNEAMLSKAARVLARDCDVVAAATDGPSAVRSALALNPDVIVLDVSMPGMSGLEVAERIRHGGSTAAVVFLTIHDCEEIVTAARACGGLGFVVKPRLVSDLMAAVRAASIGDSFTSPLPRR
jgi:DNA-binding NarL/FixJ family response regulator